MNKGYNLYNPEPQFKKYLVAGNIKPVTVKNYLSDFRHFWGWLIFYLKSQNGKTPEVKALETSGVEQPDKKLFNLLIIPKVVVEYKDYLVENNLPLKTVNRRLSTLRKFCSFCISQGWMRENPAKKIKNLSRAKPRDLKLKVSPDKIGLKSQPVSEILTDFKATLLAEDVDKNRVKDYLADIGDFFEIVSSKKTN